MHALLADSKSFQKPKVKPQNESARSRDIMSPLLADSKSFQKPKVEPQNESARSACIVHALLADSKALLEPHVLFFATPWCSIFTGSHPRLSFRSLWRLIPLWMACAASAAVPTTPATFPATATPRLNRFHMCAIYLLQQQRGIWSYRLPYPIDRLAHLISCVRGPGDLPRRRQASGHSFRPAVCHFMFYNALSIASI